MKITFNIGYKTNWGEDVKALLSISDRQGRSYQAAVPLQTSDGNLWTKTVDIDAHDDLVLSYIYALCKGEACLKKELPSRARRLTLSKKIPSLALFDSWRALPPLSYLYTSALADCINAHPLNSAPCGAIYAQTVVLRAYAPQAGKRYRLMLCGGHKALGGWDVKNALPMAECAPDEWAVTLNAELLGKTSFDYKFILCDKNIAENIFWEEGANRRLQIPPQPAGGIVFVNDAYPVFPCAPFKAAGVAAPVFSLRSKSSFGAGDFGDLKLFVDWAEKTGQKIVQILPLNDTSITNTWVDSYPYNSVSIYALHPLYMDLKALGPLRNSSQEEWFWARQKKLNALPQVDYEAVMKIKRDYIDLAFIDQARAVFASEGYQTFFDDNKHWLTPYAVFSYLRDIYDTADFHKWPKYSVYNKEEIDELASPSGRDYMRIAVYYFIQYQLHRQLKEASRYARSKGIIFKGDIPIGISPSSADAWTEPQYFHLNAQAGAPPDDFSAVGQNWGFPTYNWDEMAKDNYLWWRKRLTNMTQYFDAYRVDHILGFFRIWEIPLHSVQGLLGQFSPSLPLSAGEIASFGFNFDEKFLSPCINDEILQNIFGEKAQEIKKTFLSPQQNGFYKLLENFDTQRKVKDFFSSKTEEESLKTQEGLYTLINNVLFLRDNKDKNKFHPRINAHKDLAFKTLPQNQKDAFLRLHNYYFYERQNDFWQQKAMQKLPALTQAARMLICAEDLGMIPACVPQVLKELEILSLEVQRMPKKLNEKFADIEKYPYLSVCTISTHDMATLRGGWKEDKKQTALYYKDILKRGGSAPQDASAEICAQIVKDHLNSPSMLCILSLQDWFSTDDNLRNYDIDAERINVPAIIPFYWRYRMHINLEDLLGNENFNSKIRSLIQSGGR